MSSRQRQREPTFMALATVAAICPSAAVLSVCRSNTPATSKTRRFNLSLMQSTRSLTPFPPYSETSAGDDGLDLVRPFSVTTVAISTRNTSSTFPSLVFIYSFFLSFFLFVLLLNCCCFSFKKKWERTAWPIDSFPSGLRSFFPFISLRLERTKERTSEGTNEWVRKQRAGKESNLHWDSSMKPVPVPRVRRRGNDRAKRSNEFDTGRMGV